MTGITFAEPREALTVQFGGDAMIAVSATGGRKYLTVRTAAAAIEIPMDDETILGLRDLLTLLRQHAGEGAD